MYTKNMNRPLALLAALFALAAAARAQTAGRFDDYVLALSWEPTFCASHMSKPECSGETPDRFDASHLALHGLWPDRNNDPSHSYGYCGVDSATQSEGDSGQWCSMPPTGMSGAAQSALSQVMPGTQSCLQRHEWYKHGTCSGLSADDYFSDVVALVQAVDSSAFGQFLTAHAGGTVNAQDVRSAFESAYGSGSSADLSLGCARVNGQSALSAVTLRLSPQPPSAGALAQELLPAAGSGNCPGSFQLPGVQ